MATFTDVEIIEGYKYDIDGVDCDRPTNELAEDVHRYLQSLTNLLILNKPPKWTLGEQLDLGEISQLACELVRRTKREIDVVENSELLAADAAYHSLQLDYQRLEAALELALKLGMLIERSNQAGDVETKVRLQESIEWTREQLREARREVVELAR